MADKNDWESHPSFGTVKIARCQGQRRLFDSPCEHHSFITLSINKAERQRTDLHDTHIMPSEEIVEVAMSEVQFANMITSLNMGGGTPCTITHHEGKLVKQPERDQTKKTFEREGREHFADLLAMAKELEKLTHRKPTDLKAEDRERMRFLSLKITQDLSVNMEFFVKQIHETMEKVVSVAKAEVQAHAMNIIKRTGLNTISEKELPLRLDLEGEKEASHG